MLTLLKALDVAVTQGLNGLAASSADLGQAVVELTSYGVPLIVLAVALQWWRRQDRFHVRHVVVASGLSFLLGLGLNQVILLFIHRMRPYDAGVTHLLIPSSPDWSFPSDHATATMAVAAAFLLHRMPRVGIVFLIAAVAMMASRVLVGTHYASDVLGGALTGIAGAMLVAALYREGSQVDRMITRIL